MSKAIKIAATVIAAAAALSGAAASAAEKATVEVPYGTPAVDGVKDELYAQSKMIQPQNIAEAENEEGYAEAKVQMLWDYTGLYLFAEVSDETPDNTNTESYKQDSIEIFIDEDCSCSEVVDKNDAQYRVTAENKHSTGLNAASKFNSAVVKTGHGYNAEVWIPWRELFPQNNMTMGFDFAINDAQNGNRAAMVLWNTNKNMNWSNTLDYGQITLVYGDSFLPWDRVTPLKISLDSRLVDCSDSPPIVVDDRTLVPMRAVFERFGAEVAWNSAESTVYAMGSGKLIKLPINSKTVYVNDEPTEIDVPAMIINDRTMVPIRFVSETLEAEVAYDDYIGAVVITTKQ